MSDPAFWTDLCQRGIVQQTTLPELGTWLGERLGPGKDFYAYCGFDPTAESLHIGSLMPVLGLRRLKQAGITPIALVGGATGMIGDPSGKTSERSFLDADTLASNVAGLRKQLEGLLEGEAGKDFLLLDNADWNGKLGFIEVLRDLGKHFSVNAMVARESVRARLEDREHGISYTEFSYVILQAYDFLYLFDRYGCRLQVGGSDQWGNITAGIDLIHRRHPGQEAHGCTFPLITTASGQKFGKTEKGAIWLDARRTHPHSMYKYFFHADDADVVRYLHYFTFLSLEEIAALTQQHTEAPHLRAAHKALAREVTAIVHGQQTALACEGLEVAMHQDDVAAFEQHGQVLGLLDPATFAAAGHDPAILPVAHYPQAALDGEGLGIMQLAVDTGLFKSKGEFRREVKGPNSGFRVAGRQVTDIDARITRDTLGNSRVLQIRKGKKNKRMICFHDS